MARIYLEPDFKEFLRLLNEKQIKYLLVGGYAVTFHGYPRATQDMDLWVSPDIENSRRITDALREFGFNPDQLGDSYFTRSGQMVRMGRPPVSIEIMTSVSGVSFDECYESRIIATNRWSRGFYY